MKNNKKGKDYHVTTHNDLTGQTKKTKSKSTEYKDKYAQENLYFYDKTIHSRLKSILTKQGLSLNQAANIWAVMYVSKHEHLINK